MKKGMSLIVLVITILVMIILAGVVVIGLTENNPIDQAINAKNLTNIKSIESEVHLYITNQFSKNEKGVNLYPVKKDEGGEAIPAEDKYADVISDELKPIIKQIQDAYGATPSADTFNLDGFYILDEDKINSANEYKEDLLIFINNKTFFVVSIEGIKYNEKTNHILFPAATKIEAEVPNPGPEDPETPEQPWSPPEVVNNILDYYKFESSYSNGKDQLMVSLSNNFRNAVYQNKEFTDSKGEVWKPGDPLPNPGNMYNGKKVESMKSMFYACTANVLDLTNFDTSNILNMENMFDASVTKTLKLDNFNTENVTNMNAMFSRTKADSIDLSSFKTPKLESAWTMFSGAEAETIKTGKLDLSNVQYIGWMFSNVKNAKSLDITGLNTTKLTGMSNVFNGCDVETINLTNVTATNLTNFESVFYDTTAKTINLTNVILPKLTGMTNVFYGCTADSINLTNVNFSGLTTARYMFYGAKTGTLNLTNIDTSNVTSMENMFNNCEADAINLTNVNTDKVTNMKSMFSGNKAKTINLIGFNTSNVTSMESMFENTSVTSLKGLESFDTKKVTSFRKMFYQTKATELDISSFIFKDSYVDLVGMFAFSDTKTVHIKKQEYVTQLKRDSWSNQYTYVENYIVKP